MIFTPQLFLYILFSIAPNPIPWFSFGKKLCHNRFLGINDSVLPPVPWYSLSLESRDYIVNVLLGNRHPTISWSLCDEQLCVVFFNDAHMLQKSLWQGKKLQLTVDRMLSFITQLEIILISKTEKVGSLLVTMVSLAIDTLLILKCPAWILCYWVSIKST